MKEVDIARFVDRYSATVIPAPVPLDESAGARELLDSSKTIKIVVRPDIRGVEIAEGVRGDSEGSTREVPGSRWALVVAPLRDVAASGGEFLNAGIVSDRGILSVRDVDVAVAVGSYGLQVSELSISGARCAPLRDVVVPSFRMYRADRADEGEREAEMQRRDEVEETTRGKTGESLVHDPPLQCWGSEVPD